MSDYSWEARQLLAWKAGMTFTRPDPSALTELQEHGLVGEGHIMSAQITDKGNALLESWRQADD